MEAATTAVSNFHIIIIHTFVGNFHLLGFLVVL